MPVTYNAKSKTCHEPLHFYWWECDCKEQNMKEPWEKELDKHDGPPTSSVEALMQRLAERTTERDYHMRMGDKLAENINVLRAALESILAMHDGNQPPALNMPDLHYARRVIRDIHFKARDALSR